MMIAVVVSAHALEMKLTMLSAVNAVWNPKGKRENIWIA